MSEQKWIPVTDRLPELGDYSVLVTFGVNDSVEMVHVEDQFKDITNGRDENGSLQYTKWYLTSGVIAWMPLPEPYTESK